MQRLKGVVEHQYRDFVHTYRGSLVGASLSVKSRPRSVALLDRVHQDALAQPVLADPERLEPKLVQGRHHDRDAGDDEVGAAWLEAREPRALADREPPHAGREPSDGPTVQEVPLHPFGIVVPEAEVERRERRHRAGRAHEVGDVGGADRRRQLAVEAGTHLTIELAVAWLVHGARKREPLRERVDTEPQAHHRPDRVVFGQHVLRAAAADIEHEDGARQRAEAVPYATEREAGLGFAAHDVDPPTGRLFDRRREGAAVGRLAHGTGRHDLDVTRAEPGAALDVAAHDSERSSHRGLTERSRVGKALAEPGARLVLIDYLPCRPAEHVGDEQPDRVAADIDRGEAHWPRAKTPRRSPGGAR